jgi:hypothetical protein
MPPHWAAPFPDFGPALFPMLSYFSSKAEEVGPTLVYEKVDECGDLAQETLGPLGYLLWHLGYPHRLDAAAGSHVQS